MRFPSADRLKRMHVPLVRGDEIEIVVRVELALFEQDGRIAFYIGDRQLLATGQSGIDSVDGAIPAARVLLGDAGHGPQLSINYRASPNSSGAKRGCMTRKVVFLDRETIGPGVDLRRPSFGHEWVEYERTPPAAPMSVPHSRLVASSVCRLRPIAFAERSDRFSE